MGGFATVAGVSAAFIGLSAWWMRRRISRNWIDLRRNLDHVDPSSLVDVSGKVIIITGGNVGLGFEAALDFARRKAHVILGCRNKGQEAVDAIRNATGSTKVECIELDLASLVSVQKFAVEIKSRYGPDQIHALILNAGVWVPMEKDAKTDDGFEIHFGVNHLGHFLLVQSLNDHLARGGGASRIVFVSSALLKGGVIDFEHPNEFVYDGRKEMSSGKKKRSFAPTGYCDSKLMNALTCRHLATMLPPQVTCHALCPGFCRSSLGRNVELSVYKKILLAPIFLLIQRRTDQGAQNIVFVTLKEQSELQSGAIYRDGKIMNDETKFIDSIGTEAPKKLWDLSDKLVRSTIR